MHTAIRLAAIAIGLVAFDASAKWVSCAREGEQCRFQGRQEIAFGAGDRWTRKFFVDGVPCTTTRFGDPYPGVPKSCRINVLEAKAPVAAPQQGPDAGWRRCAGEGEACRFAGRRKIAFGAGQRWVYRIHTDGVSCQASRFGGDPAVGTLKACFILAQ